MKEKLTINDRVYGEWEIDDPLALALIELAAFERLFKVGQYGSYWFGMPEADVNRAEHSLGVYYLLKHFGATREEQIAGLLHDISHTVFSHVIDYAFGDPTKQEHQDKSHLSIIQQDSIRDLLVNAGFDYVKIADLESFPLLDRELPDLCCDRLDYFLRDSVCYGKISPQEANGILSHISYTGRMFVVDDPNIARFMSIHSVHMTEQYWGPPFGCFMFEKTAEALRRGLDLNIITEKDFYRDDFEVWDMLKQSKDEMISKSLADVENIKSLKLCLDENDYEYHITAKFRGIDPPVLVNNSVRRVSDIFPEVTDIFNKSKEMYKKGYYIKIIRD